MTRSPTSPTPVPATTPPEALRHAKGWTLHAEAGREMVGVLFGERFEVREPIGAGGMASVYVCKDRALHGLAAVKVLRDDDADARRRFADEARLLANLRHPHMVQVLAVGETADGAPYMALEYLPGQSLDERLIRRGPLPWREVVELAAQVAGALEALHRVGVIHRDVKPSNIVQIDSAAGGPVVKLIDLGIAKIHDWARVQAGGFTPVPRHKTEVGKVVGTPGFYPPEVALVEADPRFDTYALGVTIYQLCTGVFPTPGEYRPMVEVRPACKVPPELEALVAAAVAVLPEERVATAEEFQRRLEAIRIAHANDTEPFLFDGCYELIEVLGVGAKAEVYRAYHRDAARYVALKLLSARSKASFEERVRFAREARVLSAVSHPALPKLIDCRTATNRKQPFIAMALAKGKRAGEFCIAGQTLGPADLIAVGRQLAGALAALHDRGILHRDLNTSNILIDLGRETTATLIDVGMADLTDRFYAVVEQRYPTPPESRLKLGTGGLEMLEWTAPEAREGKGWTAKSDVYSLGLLLYKMLTGKRPFAGDSKEMVSPRTYVPGCPRALEAALRWALHQDPDERVDASELLAQLDEALEEMNEDAADAGAPEAHLGGATPTGATTTVRERPRRTRWFIGGVLFAAAVVLAWWGGRMTAPTLPPVATPATQVIVPPAAPEQAPVAVPEASGPATPASLPEMREALKSAAEELRRCASLSGGSLLVEFETAAGNEIFVEAKVIGPHEDRVGRCVREAADSIRFEPTAAQTFAEVYNP
ncbi:serine/threonine-protein kinase [Nannocystis sp. RBIL2]|uniref:serine/threonine-protein kinase n=1 Tax=Nannocystis sp. RBIL2 TaxID=2996788 RepID=UPI0022703430|nr:serine/threonine-protein kinase [Nannocystis sp. RBIL2]MCY1072566.1 serine/threonine-protein kinase [Nannocystis sp. RBIL2]